MDPSHLEHQHQPPPPGLAERVAASHLRLVSPDEAPRLPDPGDPTASDEDLLDWVVAGEPAALGALYDRHAPIVYAILLRIVASREAAEELLQEVFLRAWQHAATFDRSRGCVRHWLNGIAHNLALNELRRQRRRPQTARPSPTDDGDPFATWADPSPEPSVAAWCAVRDANLANALDQLPPPQRVVIELYAAGFSQSEIANRLNEPLGTVKSRMRRALGHLRTALAPLGIDEAWSAD